MTHQALLKYEYDLVDKFFKSAAWTFSADGAASRQNNLTFRAGGNNNIQHWNNAASTPVEDMRLMKRIIQEQTGFRPNVLGIGRPVFDILLDHPDIVGRIDRGQTPNGPAAPAVRTWRRCSS